MSLKLNTNGEGDESCAVSLGLKIHYYPIPWWQQTIWRPSQDLLTAAVMCIQPHTFVHCGSDSRTASYDADDDDHVGGNDRTGLLVGCYRLLQAVRSQANFQTAKKAAWAEMLMHGFHVVGMGGLAGRFDAQTPDDWAGL